METNNKHNNISKWKYFSWGASNHPGNAFYVMFTFALIIAGLRNENIVAGLSAASIIIILLLIMKLIEEEMQEDNKNEQ